MKFSEMPYTRPDVEAAKQRLRSLTLRLREAGSYAEARELFLAEQAEEKHYDTLFNLAYIRHSIDTRDAFYDGEMRFFNAAGPELQEYRQAWTRALLESPWRADFAAEYGELMFRNAEIACRTFDPCIIRELQRENELQQAYDKLLASGLVSFEGKSYTLSQMEPLKSDPDDRRRLAAWQAEGRWYRERQGELDRLYGELVRLRDAMGKKLGYEGYIPLGYDRMGRNCYGREEVERFRAAVVKYVVPMAEGLFRRQAERLGKSYPLSFADAALEFRSGNPRPRGAAADVLAAGRRFYEALSPETGVFFRQMLEEELLDVLSREGKAGGGYCTALADYGVPFIFANFNGSKGDVEVVTHEAGHAFAAWLSRDAVPWEYVWPSSEACEVHSMSMEFLAWPWAEEFFGPDARKFRYSHLAGALRFIPYGTMVDHFQHLVYEKPEMTAEERHGTWKELLGVYMPWLKLDGEIPVYGEGHGWQRQHHIYDNPFYYIDYCLAETVALELWAMSQKDFGAAWERYLLYTRQGGRRSFTELLANAGLASPFDESCLRGVCETARAWLESCDMSGLV